MHDVFCTLEDIIRREHKLVENEDVHPIISSLSFKCDQCGFKGASDKGIKQHNRTKHRISQVDGNNSESDDCRHSKSRFFCAVNIFCC